MNNKYYIGIDIGSISTKGVVIDLDNNIVASEYSWTEGSPIEATKKIIESLKNSLDSKNIDPDIYGIGTTGSARNLIGTILNAIAVSSTEE